MGSWSTDLDSLFEGPIHPIHARTSVPEISMSTTLKERLLNKHALEVMRVRPAADLWKWIDTCRVAQKKFVVAFHGCPTNEAFDSIVREGRLKPGSRNKGGIGVYGANSLEEAMTYSIDPTRLVDSGRSFRVVIFFGLLGPNPQNRPHIDADRSPLVVDRDKPHLFNIDSTRMVGVFHPDDTKVAFAVTFRELVPDYRIRFGLWKVAPDVAFAHDTGACRVRVAPPYGHRCQRVTTAAKFAHLPVFGELVAKDGYTVPNWMAALGRIIVMGIGALLYRTAPELRAVPPLRCPPIAVLAKHMAEWSKIRTASVRRASRGDSAIHETLADVWNWAVALLEVAELSKLETVVGDALQSAFFRMVFDASTILVRAISLSIGSYPEHADHAEAVIKRNAIEFTRSRLVGTSTAERIRAVLTPLGPFAPLRRPAIMTYDGRMVNRAASRNSKLCLTILTLGTAGTSPETAVVVEDDDGPAAVLPDLSHNNRKRKADQPLPPRPGPADRAQAETAAAQALVVLSRRPSGSDTDTA